MSATITIPAQKPAPPQRDAELAPYPAAHTRAQNFLKMVLRNEIELAKRDKVGTSASIIHKLGAKEVVIQFR